MAGKKTYTQLEKDALIAEFNLSSRSVNGFLSEKKAKGHDVPAYPTFSKWVSGDDNKPAAQAIKANSSLYAEFTQSLLPEDVKDKYIAFLEGKVAALQAELAKINA